MSNPNQLLYFVSQSYRQVQLSTEKGSQPYTYSQFSNQFTQLFDALGDEDRARQLTTQLIEETAQQKQTVDYLRQRMESAVQAAQPVKQAEPVKSDSDTYKSYQKANADAEAVLA